MLFCWFSFFLEPMCCRPLPYFQSKDISHPECRSVPNEIKTVTLTPFD